MMGNDNAGSLHLSNEDTSVELDSTFDVEAADEETKLDHFEPPASAAPMGDADVILIAHPENKALGARFRVPPKSKLVIGRSSECEISLSEVRSLSRRHAVLQHDGASVRIEDIDSTNGTFVNDQLLDGSRPLKSGDRFQVGAAHFKFLHEEDPEHAYHEAIHELVVRDGLTQVFNRRKFEEEMQREFARAVRHHRPLTLILFDLDHFKLVNDNHGHLCGDFILQQIAQQAGRFLRAEQVLARVGGEEFVIACPEMGVTGAVKLAERLRSHVADSVFAYGEETVSITCSFGVAQLVPAMSKAEDLFAAADQAMYQSKSRGRNCVSCYVPTI